MHISGGGVGCRKKSAGIGASIAAAKDEDERRERRKLG